jgi:predicted HNH restriction endonuclease
MARTLGYKDYQGANNYGKLAKVLCEELGYPDPKEHIPLYLLAKITRPTGHWLWAMWPQVAEALEELGWVEEKEAVMPHTEAEPLPERILATVSRIIRDTDAARSLKTRYHYRCQICGLQIQAASGSYYIEVHHIRPLGGGHDGMDEHSNMLVVCPNHHAMFDLWIPRFLNPKRIVIGQEEFQLESRHKVSADTISYYNDFREKRAV